MKTLAFLLAGCALCVGCGGGPYLRKGADLRTVDQLAYFEPLSYVSYIDKGNRGVHSDSLSGVTRVRLDSVIAEHREALKVERRITVDDPATAARVEREISSIVQQGMTGRKALPAVALPPGLDSLLEASGHRYGVGLVAAGFGRRRGNYGAQVGKGLAVGILTLGMYVPVPVKSNLTVHLVVMDAERDEVVFYNHSPAVEREPTEGSVIERQLLKAWELSAWQGSPGGKPSRLPK